MVQKTSFLALIGFNDRNAFLSNLFVFYYCVTYEESCKDIIQDNKLLFSLNEADTKDVLH